MAAVLKARDSELGRIVALKILPPEAARDHESVTRFRQEARAAALLDHDNIARVYSCGEDQGLHFIAFEFIEGENLRVLIDRRGTIPAGECVGYMIQVAAGLNHAAERGVVHRDIKPSNIVITPDGRAKIVDMGLARQLDANPANGGVTQSGVTLGTFDYISPEQALDPRRADVRSDIYSLGCAFYHALTGRPPVPEGTAAKKLHAHQHVEPLDPRQLNAHIPDELVAILARMMAKDVSRRYQSPTELIVHLKGLAERLKLSPEAVGHDSAVRALPAGQSALPQVPKLPLGWLIGVVAVVSAVAVFAITTGNPGSPSLPPPWATPQAKKDELPAIIAPGTGANPNHDGIVRTAEELADRLADPATKRVQLAPGVFDLSKLPVAVVFAGSDLELVGSVNPGTVLKVNPGPLNPGVSPPGSLTLSAKVSASVTGIRFEPPRDIGKGVNLGATLTLGGTGQVALSDCVFAADSATRSHGGNIRVFAGIWQVRADRCVFAPAGFGVQLPESRCDLTISDCGFGPHHSAVQIGDDTSRGENAGLRQGITVRLERSSFLLDPSSAVAWNPGAGREETGVQVIAEDCVFAPVPADHSFFSSLTTLRRPAVVRITAHNKEIQFSGQVGRKNAYYAVAPLALMVEDTTRYLSFDQCKVEKIPVQDAGAVTLAQRPWAETDPLHVLASRNDPWRAFRLKLTDPLLAADKVVILGAQFHSPTERIRRAYPNVSAWPIVFPKIPVVAETRKLVWQPDAKDDPLPPNTYANLAALLDKAQSGDEILIRYDGLLPLKATVELEKPRAVMGEFRLTFKPDKGYSPILTAPGGDKLDQTLFKLLNGEVAFEGVQFLLKPKVAQTVAAVTIVGGKTCAFKDCVFTLAEDDDSKAAVVVIADPAGVMKMDASRSTPDVKFERCVVRGKGRGVWVKAGRSVKADFEQSLTALDGPVYLADPGAEPNSVRSSLGFKRVTALVGGPVVELHGGKVGVMRASGLVPLDVYAEECLFAAVPGAGRSLVEIEGIDATEVASVLGWKVKADRYANFEVGAAAMTVRPGGEGTVPKDWNWDNWLTFSGEPPAAGKPVGRVTFENGPTALKELIALKPADVVVTAVNFPDLTGAKPTDAGATEKLPTPFVIE